MIELRISKMLFDFVFRFSQNEQGAGRAFSAGGDLKMFYNGRNSSNVL